MGVLGPFKNREASTELTNVSMFKPVLSSQLNYRNSSLITATIRLNVYKVM